MTAERFPVDSGDNYVSKQDVQSQSIAPHVAAACWENQGCDTGMQSRSLTAKGAEVVDLAIVDGAKQIVSARPDKTAGDKLGDSSDASHVQPVPSTPVWRQDPPIFPHQ